MNVRVRVRCSDKLGAISSARLFALLTFRTGEFLLSPFALKRKKAGLQIEARPTTWSFIGPATDVGVIPDTELPAQLVRNQHLD